MGALYYDWERIEFEDRLLAHLQVVIVLKLRRGEGFLMSWVSASAEGSGRRSIWIDPAIPLRFDLAGSRAAAIDPEWIRVLQASANGSTGLVVLDEAGAIARVGRRQVAPAASAHDPHARP